MGLDSTIFIITALVSCFIAVYLIYALLYPEKF